MNRYEQVREWTGKRDAFPRAQCSFRIMWQVNVKIIDAYGNNDQVALL